MRPRIDRAVPKPPPKVREGMSRVHLDRVKTLPCLICGTQPAGDPHHLKRAVPWTEKGKGLKAPDKYAVPACRVHHDAMHHSGDDEAYLTERGFDGRAVAAALWAHRDSPESMDRVIWRARQEALLKRGNLWA